MDTRLIYVSKDKAQVSNAKDGSFLNEVSQGIKVNVGDEISIDGIAVNSIGVGSDIIEIPEKIKDNPYLPNRQVLNGWLYINHNYKYTCPLPLSTQNTVYSTATDSNYGYLTNQGFPLTYPLWTTKTKGDPEKFDFNASGTRFYIGRWAPYNQDPDAWANATEAGAIADKTAGNFIWFPATTNIEIGVSIGYDNPSNIANKITEDMHNGVPLPLKVSIDATQGAGYNYKVNTWSKDIGQLQTACLAGGTNVVSIDGIPSSHQKPTLVSFYQNYIGYLNPQKQYYGSRLANEFTGKKNMTYYNSVLGPQQGFENQIYMLNEGPIDPTNTFSSWDDGFVMVTNLDWNETNCRNVANLLRCRQYIDDPFGAGTERATVADIETDPKTRALFLTKVDIGRCDDSPASTVAGYTQAQNRVLPNPSSSNTQYLSFAGFLLDAYFNPSKYNKAYTALTSSDQFFDLVVDNNFLIPFQGQQMNSRTIAKLLDVNIVCVNTGATFGANERCVGIILNARSLQGDPTGTFKLHPKNYCLYDPSIYHNTSVLVIDTSLAKGASSGANAITDYNGYISVGAPDMNLTFDQTRGRFGFQNMAWANIIGNGNSATAVPSAGLEALTSGYDYVNDPDVDGHTSGSPNERFAPSNNDSGSPLYEIIPFDKYSQSGIGLFNISLVDDDNNFHPIDWQNKLDIEKKFNDSLLQRLGFTYLGLCNRAGRAEVVFTERFYNSVIPQSDFNLFPFPLTTNLRIESTINKQISLNSHTLPMFDLGNQKGYVNANFELNTSSAYAQNLPQKLVFPFWLIKSNIIEGIHFNSENSGQEDQIVAVCNRAYLAGDFAFSFSTSYSFKATHPFVITGIRTSVLNPDLTPARIDDKTSIIYKIVSPIPLFKEIQIDQEIEQQQKKQARKKNSSKKEKN
tara:strand:+ start:1223 stop:3952 length:2730 start_codon:yes stop_codon:yes gene_type:complete